MNDADKGVHNGDAVDQMLAAVGLNAVEERIYLALLERPEMSVESIRGLLGLSRGTTGEVMDGLAAKGLVSRSRYDNQRYRPAPPDVAIEALAAKKQAELYRARLAARQLQERARAASNGHPNGDQMVEMIFGEHAVAQRVAQLLTAAERQVMAFGRPPYVTRGNPAVADSLRRGVSHRVIYNRGALESPGTVEDMCEPDGVQARVANVPITLTILDSRAAVMPLLTDTHSDLSMLVRSSPLLDALVSFFEFAWEHATPLTFLANGKQRVPTSGSGGASDVDQLLTLLVAGFKDESIARRLGVSTRTLDRRVQALMRDLNAVTRFQAGWAAALRYDATQRS